MNSEKEKVKKKNCIGVNWLMYGRRNTSMQGITHSTPPCMGRIPDLDFFLVEHRLLEAVTSTNIAIMTFSDHAPVSLQLKIGDIQKKSNL